MSSLATVADALKVGGKHNLAVIVTEADVAYKNLAEENARLKKRVEELESGIKPPFHYG